MEIFQTIWTALTTPNEGLTNIIVSLLSIIEATVGMLLFTTILNITASKRNKILYVVSLYLWTIISKLFINSNFLTVLSIIVSTSAIMLFFKTGIFKSIIAEILPMIVIGIFEPILVQLLIFCMNIPYLNIVVIPLYRICFILLIYLIMFLLYLICKRLNINITLFDDMNRRTKIILGFNFVFGVIAIAFQLYLSNFYNNITSLFGTISLLLYFSISMYSLTRTTRLEITEQNLEQSNLYNKSLKILHDNVRAFKHDFSNIVQAIGRIYKYQRYERSRSLLFSIVR